MEIRKIQVTGGASFIVSLPKQWARENNLQKNDKVGIIPRNDGSILITMKIKGDQILKIRDFNVAKIKDQTTLFRMLLGAYIRGYNIFRVVSDTRISPAIRDTLRDFIRAAIGLEIIEETSNTVTIKDLLDPTEMPFDKAIRRISTLVTNMHQDALFSLAHNDETLARDVITRDDDVDRLHWLISRQYNIVSNDIYLAELLGFDRQKNANYSLIGRTVERIGDHAVNIATNVLHLIDKKLDTSIIDKITSAGYRAVDIFTDSIDAFFNEDIEAANNTIDENEAFATACEDLENIALLQSGLIAVSIGYIGESIRRIGEYSSDLAEYVINYLVEEK